MNLYERAIALWGEEFQLDMMVEECAELILAISKLKRQGIGHQQARLKVIEEIADVRLMLNTMNFVFAKRAIRNFVRYKMDRLKLRIEQEEEEYAKEIRNNRTGDPVRSGD